jgi:hypothetical protein
VLIIPWVHGVDGVGIQKRVLFITRAYPRCILAILTTLISMLDHDSSSEPVQSPIPNAHPNAQIFQPNLNAIAMPNIQNAIHEPGMLTTQKQQPQPPQRPPLPCYRSSSPHHSSPAPTPPSATSFYQQHYSPHSPDPHSQSPAPYSSNPP